MESDRAQRIKAKEDVKCVSEMGELQQTMDQLGELKRGDCWVQRTESIDAQRISADRAEATLQILGELNLNMCSKFEKQGARVNFEQQKQLVRGLMDTERRKDQTEQVM